jgi:hypothetical protein
MPTNLLEQFFNAIKTDNPYAIAAVVLVSLVLSFRSVLSFIETRQARRNELLENGLKHQYLDETVRLAIEENRNSFYFAMATGIKANKQLRTKIIDINERSNGEISPFQLAKVKNLLKLQNGKLCVSITGSDWFAASINLLCACLLTSFASLLLIAAIVPSAMTTAQTLSLILASCLLQLASVYLSTEAVSIWKAQKLSKIIEKTESKETSKLPEKEVPPQDEAD